MQPNKVLANHRVLLAIGIILTISGIALVCTSPMIFNYVIGNELVLSPQKRTFNAWQKTQIPLSMDFYFFNWTNPEDLNNPSIKPHFVQMGPYRYTESREKVDIVFNRNDTVSYKHLRYWYFDAENSNGSLTDEITTLNAVAASASYQAKSYGYLLQKGLSLSMTTLVKTVHLTKTVRELLFDGYKDPLMDVARTMPAMPGVELPPFDKFGWFYSRNGSADYDGTFTIATGTGATPIGSINLWNQKEYTKYFDKECGHVSGSTGEFWPQYVTKDYISMFSADLCRRVDFEYEREIVINGLTGYKFIGGKRSIDNGTLYPENKCFNSNSYLASGLMNVSSCRYGSPSFISYPHFYNADPIYLQQVEGLSPNKELHELSITLEPRTGIPIAVAARFQVNILLERNDNIGLFSEVPRIFFPMLWFEQKVTMPKEFSFSLRQVLCLPTVGQIISAIVMVCGLIILFSLFSIYFYHSVQIYLRNKRLKQSHYLNGNAEQTPLSNGDIKEQILFKKGGDA